jgi:hypothetical protein
VRGLLLRHGREDVFVAGLSRVGLRTQLVHQVGRVLLVDLDDPASGRLTRGSPGAGEVGRRLLQLLLGGSLVLTLVPELVLHRRPGEETLLVVGSVHLRGPADGPVLELAGAGASERLADGLERGGVVPIVPVLVILERRRWCFPAFASGGGRRDGGLGLAADGDVLVSARPVRRRRFLRLVPLDVLDRGEELVEVLEQVVALALVVGH